jgi:hypothetical protein
MNQLIFKSACWNCKKAWEDPQEQYTCPQFTQHWIEWEKQQTQFQNL